MSDRFNSRLVLPATVTAWSLESLMAGNAIAGIDTATSGTWPVANKAVFYPFVLAEPGIVTGFFLLNGATVSGNVDMGLYLPNGTRLVSAGSTAQSGTSVIQIFNTTDMLLGPGLYYWALALDNTTGTTVRVAAGGRGNGIYQQTTAFPLPSSATFAVFSGTSVTPICGVILGPRGTV